MSGVLENRVVQLPVERSQPPVVSPVRAVLGGYQLVYDQIDAQRGVVWIRPGRWLRCPAPRALTRTFVTYHVRARVDVLRRRGRAQAALMKDADSAEANLKRLDLFAESLPATPKSRLVTLGAIIGVLLAAFVLAKLVIAAESARMLGELSEAALTLDSGAAVDAVQRDPDPENFVGIAVILLWSLALIALPLAPASWLARRLLRTQPGLREAEARAFAELRAPRPADHNLVAMIEWLLVIPMLVFGLWAVLYSVVEPADALIGVVFAAVLLPAAAGVIRSMRHRDEHASARTLLQKAARRVTFGGYVIVLILSSAF